MVGTAWLGRYSLKVQAETVGKGQRKQQVAGDARYIRLLIPPRTEGFGGKSAFELTEIMDTV